MHTPPVKAPEWGPDEAWLPGRIWAPQGGLSRNKVAVGESAAGSPPNDRDWGSPQPTPSIRVRDRGRPSTFELPGLTGRAHSSAVECLLCKEDALGSNPSGSTFRTRLEPSPLSGKRVQSGYAEPMHHSVQARVGRVDARPLSTDVCMRPCVRAIQTLTGPVSSGRRAIYHYRGYCAIW